MLFTEEYTEGGKNNMANNEALQLIRAMSQYYRTPIGIMPLVSNVDQGKLYEIIIGTGKLVSGFAGMVGKKFS
jgi:hypothetical protein